MFSERGDVTHQWTRQPSPFRRDSWINTMLSLKYWVLTKEIQTITEWLWDEFFSEIYFASNVRKSLEGLQTHKFCLEWSEAEMQRYVTPCRRGKNKFSIRTEGLVTYLFCQIKRVCHISCCMPWRCMHSSVHFECSCLHLAAESARTGQKPARPGMTAPAQNPQSPLGQGEPWKSSRQVKPSSLKCLLASYSTTLNLKS